MTHSTFDIRHSTSRGFTLVELLVVVAVIAVLISILVPSLREARSSALQTTCMGNVHGIGTGIFMYAGDWDDALPPNHICDLPSWVHRTCDDYWATPQEGDLRGLCPDYVFRKMLICPGFRASPVFARPNYQSYWMGWLDSLENWLNAPDRHFIGYYYLYADHITWEQRYGIYRDLRSLKLGKAYPCGHFPSGRFNLRMLVNCLSYNGAQITPYWQALEDVAEDYPWEGFGHDPGRTRGSNLLLGDGQVVWAGVTEMTYQYNGWATADWRDYQQGQ